MTAETAARPLVIEVLRDGDSGSAEPERVSALLVRPARASALFVFAHGAGAGMRHAFMEEAAAALAHRGIATLRYQFPYVERDRRRPDLAPVLTATVRAAVEMAGTHAEGLPIFAGGKSMGGRMTSLAASEAPLPGLRGLVFVGFPLHPAGRASIDRAAHLVKVGLPMLFLQGTRDDLADLVLLRGVVAGLGSKATLHIVDGADHSFRVLKSVGRTTGDVLDELADVVARWTNES